MEDELRDFDTVSIDQLDTITLALEQYLSVANVNGKLFKSKISDLVVLIAPFIPAATASNFAPVSGTVLPNNTIYPSQFTIVGAGTFTQTTGGSIITTSLLNILGWNGTKWSLLKAIDSSSLVSKTDVIDDLTTGGSAKVLSAEQGKILKTTIDNLSGKTFTLGVASPAAGTPSDNRTWFFVTPISDNSVLKLFKAYASTAGLITIKRVSIDGANYLIKSSITLNLTQGVNDIAITQLFRFTKGDLIAFYSTAQINFKTETPFSEYRYTGVDTDARGALVIASQTLATTSNFQVKFTFESETFLKIGEYETYKDGALAVHNLRPNGISSYTSFPIGTIGDNGVLINTTNPLRRNSGYLDISKGTSIILDGFNQNTRYGIFDANVNLIGTVKETPINQRVTFEKPANAKYLLTNIYGGGAELDYSKLIYGYLINSGFSTYDDVVRELSNAGNIKEIGEIYLGAHIHTFPGDDCRVYAESVFSGWNPRQNFFIRLTGTSFGSFDDKGRFVQITKSGTLTVDIFNTKNVLLDTKTIPVTKLAARPTALKVNAPQVLFIGDSLIHNNVNKIGEEWLRMLNTNDPVEKINGDAVQLPTIGIGNGTIQLVGSSGTALNKYTLANKFSTIMTKTNVEAGTDINPFYNPNSTAPNELDSDGYNKRVDFAWYLQQICGAGKYPRYIFLACGVNDIVELGWTEAILPIVTEKMVLFLSKLKQACDTIAGGTSNVQVILMNHQFYPFNEGHYKDFDVWNQRRLWTKHYKNYAAAINTRSTTNGIPLSNFTRFVDCASQFDVEYGYAYNPIRVNPRNNIIQRYVVDTVHMGDNGAYQYADALIRDFLYYECI